jgi:hypothetical protein
MDEALEQRGLPLIDAIVTHAHAANPAAMRLCLDRILPMGKHKPSSVTLPPADTPNYTMAALGEIHRALGDGEITTDEATRLLGFVERTTRILASKALTQIDLADRLARCEEALTKCLMLLGVPAPMAEIKAEAAAPAPKAAEPAAADAPIANNNAETMGPWAAEAGRPFSPASSERPAVAKNNGFTTPMTAEAGEALCAPPVDARPRRRSAAVDRLLGSTSPLAHLASAMPGKAMPAMPPRAPLVGAA